MFKQFQTIIVAFGSALAIVAGGILSGNLFVEQKDPLWLRIDSLQRKQFFMLEQSVDSLFYLRNNLLENDFNSAEKPDSSAFKRINKPFVPTMEFKKFREYSHKLVEKQRLTLGSVTGSGASTLAMRLLNFWATNETCKMEVLCAPMFDLELHKMYIGTTDANGVFKKGELLQMWDDCVKNPDKNYVCLISGFDKINPETFFGPALWQKMGDDRMEVVLGGEKIVIPSNFYLISVVHTGVSSLIELNNEHFKRLGGLELLPVNEVELLQYLRDTKKDLTKKIAKASNVKEKNNLLAQQKALTDNMAIQKFVYLFAKTNEFISQNYSPSHQLGQWNDVRKMFLPAQQSEFLTIFEQHVNAFKPTRNLAKTDFAPVLYSLQHGGDIGGTSPFRIAIQKLVELGFMNEALVAFVSLLLTGVVGWWFIRRKKRLVRSRIEQLYAIIADWESREIDYIVAQNSIRAVKREIDDLVLNDQLDYDAAAFFYAFIGDRLHEIEAQQSAQRQFEQLLETFLEDGILSEREKLRLAQVLERIRYQLPPDKYEYYKNELEIRD